MIISKRISFGPLDGLRDLDLGTGETMAGGKAGQSPRWVRESGGL